MNNSGNVQSILSVTEHVENMKDKRTLLNCKPFNIIKADSSNFCKKYSGTGFTSTKIRAIETTFALGVEPKLRERFVKQKRNEDAIRNLPQKVFETKYFLITVRAFMVLTRRFEKSGSLCQQLQLSSRSEENQRIGRRFQNAVYEIAHSLVGWRFSRHDIDRN
jgi:hypothetical protein